VGKVIVVVILAMERTPPALDIVVLVVQRVLLVPTASPRRALTLTARALQVQLP